MHSMHAFHNLRRSEYLPPILRRLRREFLARTLSHQETSSGSANSSKVCWVEKQELG